MRTRGAGPSSPHQGSGADIGQEVVGALRLGVSNYISKPMLPGLLKRFRESFPKADHKVVTGWSRDVFDLAYNQEIHIGIVRGDYPWPGAKRLFFEEHVSVTSKDKIRLQDLPGLPRIEYVMDPLMKAMTDQW